MTDRTINTSNGTKRSHAGSGVDKGVCGKLGFMNGLSAVK